MSKAQKGNKENKKPKADKNQPRATISAYRTAQGQGKPASSPFARKKRLRVVRSWAMQTARSAAGNRQPATGNRLTDSED